MFCVLFRVPLNGLPYWIAIVLTAALLGRDWRPQGSGSVGVVMLASAAVAYEGGLDLCCPLVDSDIACFETCQTVVNESSNSSLLTSHEAQSISTACPPTYSHFWACFNHTVIKIDNPTSATPPEEPTVPLSAENEACCNSAGSSECREACLKYAVYVNQEKYIENAIEACGSPPFGVWQCFLNPNPIVNTVKDQPPVDWARVQCCYQAKDEQCRDSCLMLYSGVISSDSWQLFQLDCIHRPEENALSTCLSDVGAPCKMGCSGLSYCRNFNSRPTTSFRHCTPSADAMAKYEYWTWEETGLLPYPLLPVYIKNPETCEPESWKALSCIMHIQPCEAATHATQICRADCLRLLKKCSNSTITPQSLCEFLSPPETDSFCLPISDFLDPSPYVNTEVAMVTNPCDPNPCSPGFFCSINHLCRAGDSSCSFYTCQSGCMFGDAPSFSFPTNSRVKVSLPSSDGNGGGGGDGGSSGCYGYLNCSASSVGSSEDTGVSPGLMHCENMDGCTVPGGYKYAHTENFWYDCNFCSCFHGRVVCTERNCSSTGLAGCSCPPEYKPICTKDGRTLPNPCTANFLGYSSQDYYNGDCSSLDPCSSAASCPPWTKCVINRHVCLASTTEEGDKCQQFTCEPVDQECGHLSSPVCDTSHNQHTSLCALLRTQDNLDYHGYCKSECFSPKPICGVNLETYETQCHAESVHVAVDYLGPCAAVPGSVPDKKSCDGVSCPPLPTLKCGGGIVPTDACCPKCGPQVTVLVDSEHLHKNTEVMASGTLSSIQIIQRLKNYITTIQCDLYGRVTLDGSLSLMVLPVINASATVVIEACNQEAVKLATFINNRTPMLASDPILSHMVAAWAEPVTIVHNPTAPPHSSFDPSASAPISGATTSAPKQLPFFLLVLLVLEIIAGTVNGI